MSTELRLLVGEENATHLEGWWVAAGNSCPTCGIGVLVVVSPAEAETMRAHGHDAAQVRARIRCAAQAFARAIEVMTGRTVLVAQQLSPPGAPPIDPRRQ